MIVLVCGGRDYIEFEREYDVLDAIHAETPITLLIHGAASGADSIAARWAQMRGITEEGHPADWMKYDHRAGPIRNEAMLARNPDLVVAFPGGKGTAHMVRIAKKKGTKVLEVE